MIELLKRIVAPKDVSKFVPGIHFNPNFDGNALAWYDGNIGLTNIVWRDQGVGSHDIVMTNLPTIVPGATPLRDAVLFDGINQRGIVATPALAQPYTIYAVLTQMTWTLSDYLFGDGANLGRKGLFQRIATPTIALACGANLSAVPDLVVGGSYVVLTCLANGVSSEIRTNDNVAVVGNAGALNGSGISLGSRFNSTGFGNCAFAYLIIRTGADSTAKQNKIINGLKAICGLTF